MEVSKRAETESIPNEPHETPTPSPKTAPRTSPPPVSKVEPAPPAPESAVPVETTPPPPPPAPPRIPPPEKRELENRVINVSAQIDGAEQAIEPIRQSLAATGSPLNPDLTATISRMHAAFDRANRDLAEGNAPAAREDLAAASALAAKVLRAVGR